MTMGVSNFLIGNSSSNHSLSSSLGLTYLFYITAVVSHYFI